MDNNIFYDKLLSTQKLTDQSFELPVQTEILLADYEKPVFKVVKTVMEHSVTNRYTEKNKVVAEGFIKLHIWYQPPQGGALDVISQKLPFLKQLEFSAGETEVSFIEVTGCSQYVNTRPTSPTRIEVRGAYQFNIRVYGTKQNRAITAIKGDNICCDSLQTEGFYLAGQNVRQFTIENQLDLPKETGRIIRINTHITTPQTTLHKGRVAVKGDIAAEIFYTETDGAQIKSCTENFTYNQLVDITSLQQNHVVYPQVEISSFAVIQNSETEKYTASITVQLDVRAFAKQSVIAVTDAFSRSFGYAKQQQTAFYDKNIIYIDKTFSVNIPFDMPQGCRVADAVAEICPPKSYYEFNKTTVKSRVTANVITVNENMEYDLLCHTRDITLDWLENCGRHDEIILSLAVQKTGVKGKEAEIVLNARGIVMEKQPLSLVSTFEEDEKTASEDGDEAFIVYYAQRGERVFDIAKNHLADPKDIMQQNGLQQGEITENRLLFIPAYKW